MSMDPRDGSPTGIFRNKLAEADGFTESAVVAAAARAVGSDEA
jgi:hypothetical protein